MRRTIWLASVAAVGLASSAWADPFAGRSYTISATPNTEARQGGARSFGEEVSFRQGRLSAAAFAMYGFVPAGYTVTTDDTGKSSFHATLDGGERGSLVWSGTVNSGGFAGTLTWTRPDATPVVYTVTGTVITTWYELGEDDLVDN
jgi:hypothetical protein